MDFDKDLMLQKTRETEEFFNRSSKELKEENSGFKPTPEMMSAAQQVAHTAATIHWFIDGAFSGEGFDMDFERAAKENAKVNSLKAAREQLGKAFDRLRKEIETRPADEWEEEMEENEILPGAPCVMIMPAIVDHTA